MKVRARKFPGSKLMMAMVTKNLINLAATTTSCIRHELVPVIAKSPSMSFNLIHSFYGTSPISRGDMQLSIHT